MDRTGTPQARRGTLIVGIDASALGKGGGVTHLIQLLEHAEPEGAGVSRVIVWSRARILDRLPNRPWLDKRPSDDLETSLLRRVRWQRSQLPKLLSEAGCNVLLAPGGTVLPGLSVPTVTMFRNSLPFEPIERGRYPLFSRARLRLRILNGVQRRSMERADGVIFLTEYARRLGLRSFQPTDHTLIPHGIDARFRRKPRPQQAPDRYSLENPFQFLYVSHVDRYKHQWVIVEAFGRLRAEGLPISLDLVGYLGDRHAGRLLQEALNEWDPSGANLRYVGAVDFADLHIRYEQADAFVFGSSCENLPNTLLEAMAAGLPIASSNAGPMPEVLQHAGAYFNPTDAASVAEAVRSIFDDHSARERYAADAVELAANYSWRSCADQTFAYLADRAGVAADA